MSSTATNKDHITYMDNKSNTLYRYYCNEDCWYKRVNLEVRGVTEGAMAVELFQERLNKETQNLLNARTFIDFDESQRPMFMVQGWKEVSQSDAQYLLGLMYEELDWYATHLLQQEDVVSSVEEIISQEKNGLQEGITDEEKMRLLRDSIKNSNHSLELSQSQVSMGRGGRIQYLEQMIGCLVEKLNESKAA